MLCGILMILVVTFAEIQLLGVDWSGPLSLLRIALCGLYLIVASFGGVFICTDLAFPRSGKTYWMQVVYAENHRLRGVIYRGDTAKYVTSLEDVWIDENNVQESCWVKVREGCGDFKLIEHFTYDSPNDLDSVTLDAIEAMYDAIKGFQILPI